MKRLLLILIVLILVPIISFYAVLDLFELGIVWAIQTTSRKQHRPWLKNIKFSAIELSGLILQDMRDSCER